jgi:hypothetical protein
MSCNPSSAGSKRNLGVLDADVEQLEQLPKKRRRKGATGEKRLARFRSKCPVNIMERVDRVMAQRYCRHFLYFDV